MYFYNPTVAFEVLYDNIMDDGYYYDGTKCLFNVGFRIENPLENIITTPWRKFNSEYAEYEWQWYLSGDPDARKIAKKAKIWYKCMDDDGFVNSNYGYHWEQNNQIGYVVNELTNNPNSRRAAISIYNAKDRHNWDNDTPCTYAIQFYIHEGRLNMSVMMRSNDLVFGFCNDQYCFSKLQELISKKLQIKVGTYYHFVNNLHIYSRHFKLKSK
jgi:thymidylate synthase